MTRSVEIPEEALEAAARALFVDQDGEFVQPEHPWLTTFEGSRRAKYTRRATLALTAALPYLAPAEPAAGAALDFRQAAEEANVRMGQPRDWALPRTGDGGLQLREALEERKATLHDWVADWPTNKEYEAWTEEIEFIERTLAAHPAAPAVLQPVDREALAALVEMWEMLTEKGPIDEFDRGVRAARLEVIDALTDLLNDQDAVLASEQEQGSDRR